MISLWRLEGGLLALAAGSCKLAELITPGSSDQKP